MVVSGAGHRCDLINHGSTGIILYGKDTRKKPIYSQRAPKSLSKMNGRIILFHEWLSENQSGLKSFLLSGKNEVNETFGAIVGSVYELHYIKTKDCFFTDVTVMTCVVAEIVMIGGKRDVFIDAMKGYDGRFRA